MGSMTGAPKKAMELIEQFECNKEGFFLEVWVILSQIQILILMWSSEVFV